MVLRVFRVVDDYFNQNILYTLFVTVGKYLPARLIRDQQELKLTFMVSSRI